jgi:hypothetical protein
MGVSGMRKACGQNCTRWRHPGFPLVGLEQNVHSNFMMTFHLTSSFHGEHNSANSQSSLVRQEGRSMLQSVHSRLALRPLLKLQRCAEGCFAREWTCWKPHKKTP